MAAAGSLARIIGRERALRRMAAIPKAAQDHVKAQLAANAADLVAAQKARAPVKTGSLRDSIRFDDVSDETRIRFIVRAGGALTTRKIGSRTYDRQVLINTGDTQGRHKQEGGHNVTFDYARAQEFGTSDQAAQPFFFPTYRGRRRGYKSKLKKAGKQGVKAAVKTP